MISVKGVYKDGQVTLLEPVPPQLVGPQEVTVTFEEVTSVGKDVTDEAAAASLAILGLLEDMDPEQEEAFDAALKRDNTFFGPREATW
jgi:hypothetical protein